MTDAYKGRLLEAAENEGWSVSEDEHGGVEFEKHSPAGEDFLFYIHGKDIVSGVREYAYDFDTEEHVTMLVIAKNNGFAGVPSIRELCDDADEIQRMLDELADALEAVDEDEEEDEDA